MSRTASHLIVFAAVTVAGAGAGALVSLCTGTPLARDVAIGVLWVSLAAGLLLGAILSGGGG